MKFNKKYFVNSEISNYVDYDNAKSYEQLCKDILRAVPVHKLDRIFDYGCATGKLLNQFALQGYASICGYDVSSWAIKHGQIIYPKLQNLISTKKKDIPTECDWLICLDVLEHMDNETLYETLLSFQNIDPTQGLLVRIPVVLNSGEDYPLEVSRKDKTHIQRLTKDEWKSIFEKFGFTIFQPITGKDIYDSDEVLAWLIK